MRWYILALLVFPVGQSLWELIFEEQDYTHRFADVLVIGLCGWASYWFFFNSGLFG